MFDFDAGKLIVIGIVALIAIPSKDLPRVLRTLGQVMGRTRRMAAEFQGQLMEALREAEVADLKKEFEETNRRIMDSVKVEGAFDPLAEARKQIVRAVEDEPRPQSTQSATQTGEGPPLEAFVETPPDAASRDADAETSPATADRDEASDPSDKKAAS